VFHEIFDNPYRKLQRRITALYTLDIQCHQHICTAIFNNTNTTEGCKTTRKGRKHDTGMCTYYLLVLENIFALLNTKNNSTQQLTTRNLITTD
jgi:hypothetical protein